MDKYLTKPMDYDLIKLRDEHFPDWEYSPEWKGGYSNIGLEHGTKYSRGVSHRVTCIVIYKMCGRILLEVNFNMLKTKLGRTIIANLWKGLE